MFGTGPAVLPSKGFGLVWWETVEDQVRGGRGENWMGGLEACGVRGCFSALLTEFRSSWDQLQAVPFRLSVWAQWLGNAWCDIPKLCCSVFSLPFVSPSGLPPPPWGKLAAEGQVSRGLYCDGGRGRPEVRQFCFLG